MKKQTIELASFGAAIETAQRLQNEAERSIYLTMEANEEKEHSLPKQYYENLRKVMDKGVKVTRIGFGTTQEFETLRDRVYIEHPNYMFHQTSATDYERMVLVDDSRLMFLVDDGKTKRRYYSTDPARIAKYKKYFELHIPKKK
ncbi:MAG: hypothetical protein AAB480_04960 [Patescibacteria group bacterium]